ncbi:putative tyrosine-specific transporter [Senna tora]|uniref:Putative tyrosine-specific transporter n=1 Tax=Senna tora TaxID=362788 RepID=A0A834WFU2_9FABA|nr:putative tyrosine-specific transporter [Senna tora]
MFSSSSSTLPPSFQVPKSLVIPSRKQQLSNLHECFVQRQSQSAQEEEVLEIERLFSNLNQATLKREPGSLSSAIFLVAGTTVGAGILAIPAVTQESGFLASAVVCIVCWVFMVVTGLLIAEVNVNTMCELGSGGVSLVSMARRTLGTAGVQISCWSYIFIHYALLVAYVARSSDILTNFLGIPSWESATLFSLVFGGICFFGSQRFIGAVNGILVFGIISSFAALVVRFSHQELVLVFYWFHFLDLGGEVFAYHLFLFKCNCDKLFLFNIFDGINKKLVLLVVKSPICRDLSKVRDSLTAGGIYVKGNNEMGLDPIQILRSTNGTVGPIVEAFSFLAIATSYIGFVLGLADFLADLLELPTGQNRPLPYLLALIPPPLLALLDPEIFFKALDFAGTYGVLVLFGIIPAAMSWSDRYSSSDSSPSVKIPELVPGGRITLLLVLGGAGYVVLSELLQNFQKL